MNIIIFVIVFASVCSGSVLKEGRIVRGTSAANGDIPYQVGLSLNRGYPGWCGGSLINDQWILTAAHCTYNTTGGKVFLGTVLRGRSDYTYSVPQENIFTHPGFKPKHMKNDIALIKLPTPISFTNEIQPIKLAKDNKRTYVNRIATASGWGSTADNSFLSDTLNYAELPIISIAKCRSYYGSNILKMHICGATTSGSATCGGDSGGPLTIKLTNGERVQIGLTSFISSRGCQSGEPSIFSRISNHIPWIQKHTKDFETAL